MKRKHIKLFCYWPEETAALTYEEKGRLIDAIVMYARGESVHLEGNERFLFPYFKGQLDKQSQTRSKGV